MTTALDELKAIPHWVGWHAEERGGKVTKVPKNPHTGNNASSNDPKTWADVNTAWRAVKRHGWTGLGFVFTIGTGIVGVDLDDCFEPAPPPGKRRLKPWAYDIYRMLNSFTEKSPSGNGLHIYCKGEIPASINRSAEGVEMYNELRYFTVTGDVFYPGPKNAPIAERSTELQALYWCFGDGPKEEPSKPRVYTPNSVDEKQIADALKHIPKRMDYYDWLRVLMAVHDAFPNSTGIRLCEAWSPGYDGEVEHKFRSFDRTAKSGVTVATLFHMAKENGWQTIRPQKRRVMTHKQKMAALAAA